MSFYESEQIKAKEMLLQGKRILVCGKGGCGKSSITALIGKALQEKNYSVIMLDGDASNPGGLCRLLFGDMDNPEPLFNFFGGREKVDCPVDDPKPLTRLNDNIPITDKKIDIAEIPAEYIIERNGIRLLQVGKIKDSFEGCDGPMSKVSRDFVVKGHYVTLLDVEAGIEHFGRGIEKNIDILLTVIDPTYESFFVAEKVAGLARQMNINNTWGIINKVRSRETENRIRSEIAKRGINILDSIEYDPEVELSGLTGNKIEKTAAFAAVYKLIEKLENTFTEELLIKS